VERDLSALDCERPRTIRRANRLVNKQARVGVLLAGPGLIATLTFAPIVNRILYTAKIRGGSAGPALDSLGGQLLQVITWPMGHLIRRKRKAGIFLNHGTWPGPWLVSAMAWICVIAFGLNGAGIGSLDPKFFMDFCSIVFFCFFFFFFFSHVRRISGFRWSWDNNGTD